MLTISTIPEALAELEKHTGRAWTEFELFDTVTRYGIELHAAAPITAQIKVEKFINGMGMVEDLMHRPADYDYLLEPFIVPNSHSGLAVLFPAQVNQLRIRGETLARHPSDWDEIEGKHKVFTEPVRVSREQVRIKAATLGKILNTLHTAQDKQAAPAAKVEAVPGTSPSGDEIPGKMPNILIGKLAIKAAWKIECGTGKRATAKQVIETLQSWVDHRGNPEAVTELTGKIPNGVKWVTCAGKENDYDIGACQKALETWNKSRD